MIKRNLLKFGVIAMVSACLVGCGDDNKKKSQETTSTIEIKTEEETTLQEETTSFVVENVTQETTTETPTEQVTTEPLTEKQTEKKTEKQTEKKTEKKTQKVTESTTKKQPIKSNKFTLEEALAQGGFSLEELTKTGGWDTIDQRIEVKKCLTEEQLEELERLKQDVVHKEDYDRVLKEIKESGSDLGWRYYMEVMWAGRYTSEEIDNIIYNISGVDWKQRAYERAMKRFGADDGYTRYDSDGNPLEATGYFGYEVKHYLMRWDYSEEFAEYAATKWAENPPAKTERDWFEECRLDGVGSASETVEEFISWKMYVGYTYDEAMYAAQFWTPQ